jgi:hypothetical protein
MPRARINPPDGTVFVCPYLCGFQSRPLLNDDVETKDISPYKCPSCGKVGSLTTWTRPWYKVDTLWQSVIEHGRILSWRWRRKYCQNLAQHTLVMDRRGVYKLTGKLNSTVKMPCERARPFGYSSKSFKGSGWTQVLLCGACVEELAEAGRKLSEGWFKMHDL